MCCSWSIAFLMPNNRVCNGRPHSLTHPHTLTPTNLDANGGLATVSPIAVGKLNKFGSCLVDTHAYNVGSLPQIRSESITLSQHRTRYRERRRRLQKRQTLMGLANRGSKFLATRTNAHLMYCFNSPAMKRVDMSICCTRNCDAYIPTEPHRASHKALKLHRSPQHRFRVTGVPTTSTNAVPHPWEALSEL